MICLIDSDTLCYASAAMAESEGEGIARWNLDQQINKLLRDLGNPQQYEFWITGKGNFRHQLFPEYKAGRLKLPRPKFLEVCRQHLLCEYNAHISDGCEADDMLAIGQTLLQEQGVESLISSIDKDLLQVAGWHFRPEIKRKGIIVKPEERKFVSPLDGLRFFYTQLITGDPTDGIKGVVGSGKKAAKILQTVDTEKEMFNIVREMYNCDEEMLMNGQCLWMWRSIGDTWKFPSFEAQE